MNYQSFLPIAAFCGWSFVYFSNNLYLFFFKTRVSDRFSLPYIYPIGIEEQRDLDEKKRENTTLNNRSKAILNHTSKVISNFKTKGAPKSSFILHYDSLFNSFLDLSQSSSVIISPKNIDFPTNLSKNFFYRSSDDRRYRDAKAISFDRSKIFQREDAKTNDISGQNLMKTNLKEKNSRKNLKSNMTLHKTGLPTSKNFFLLDKSPSTCFLSMSLNNFFNESFDFSKKNDLLKIPQIEKQYVIDDKWKKINSLSNNPFPTTTISINHGLFDELRNNLDYLLNEIIFIHQKRSFEREKQEEKNEQNLGLKERRNRTRENTYSLTKKLAQELQRTKITQFNFPNRSVFLVPPKKTRIEAKYDFRKETKNNLKDFSFWNFMFSKISQSSTKSIFEQLLVCRPQPPFLRSSSIVQNTMEGIATRKPNFFTKREKTLTEYENNNKLKKKMIIAICRQSQFPISFPRFYTFQHGAQWAKSERLNEYKKNIWHEQISCGNNSFNKLKFASLFYKFSSAFNTISIKNLKNIEVDKRELLINFVFSKNKLRQKAKEKNYYQFPANNRQINFSKSGLRFLKEEKNYSLQKLSKTKKSFTGGFTSLCWGKRNQRFLFPVNKLPFIVSWYDYPIFFMRSFITPSVFFPQWEKKSTVSFSQNEGNSERKNDEQNTIQTKSPLDYSQIDFSYGFDKKTTCLKHVLFKHHNFVKSVMSFQAFNKLELVNTKNYESSLRSKKISLYLLETITKTKQKQKTYPYLYKSRRTFDYSIPIVAESNLNTERIRYDKWNIFKVWLGHGFFEFNELFSNLSKKIFFFEKKNPYLEWKKKNREKNKFEKNKTTKNIIQKNYFNPFKYNDIIDFKNNKGINSIQYYKFLDYSKKLLYRNLQSNFFNLRLKFQKFKLNMVAGERFDLINNFPITELFEGNDSSNKTANKIKRKEIQNQNLFFKKYFYFSPSLQNRDFGSIIKKDSAETRKLTQELKKKDLRKKAEENKVSKRKKYTRWLASNRDNFSVIDEIHEQPFFKQMFIFEHNFLFSSKRNLPYEFFLSIGSAAKNNNQQIADQKDKTHSKNFQTIQPTNRSFMDYIYHLFPLKKKSISSIFSNNNISLLERNNKSTINLFNIKKPQTEQWIVDNKVGDKQKNSFYSPGSNQIYFRNPYSFLNLFTNFYLINHQNTFTFSNDLDNIKEFSSDFCPWKVYLPSFEKFHFRRFPNLIKSLKIKQTSESFPVSLSLFPFFYQKQRTREKKTAEQVKNIRLDISKIGRKKKLKTNLTFASPYLRSPFEQSKISLENYCKKKAKSKIKKFKTTKETKHFWQATTLKQHCINKFCDSLVKKGKIKNQFNENFNSFREKQKNMTSREKLKKWKISKFSNSNDFFYSVRNLGLEKYLFDNHNTENNQTIPINFSQIRSPIKVLTVYCDPPTPKTMDRQGYQFLRLNLKPESITDTLITSNYQKPLEFKSSQSKSFLFYHFIVKGLLTYNSIFYFQILLIKVAPFMYFSVIQNSFLSKRLTLFLQTLIKNYQLFLFKVDTDESLEQQIINDELSNKETFKPYENKAIFFSGTAEKKR